MSRTIFLYVILITLFIAGCTPPPASEPLNTPAPKPSKSDLPVLDSEWKIRMKHSGGIMGLSRLIEISSDGKFTIVDERANKKIAGEFSAGKLSKINELVISSKYVPATKSDGMGCADCFIYDLEIQNNGQKFTTQLNDISLPNSGLESLVDYLRDLIETELK